MQAGAPNLLDEIQAGLDRAWHIANTDFEDADWSAIYKGALAIPCFRRGYAVACRISPRHGLAKSRPEVRSFRQFTSLFQPNEQALDLLALDRRNLRPILGAELEWTANRSYRVKKNDRVLRKIWGEEAIPRDDYIAEVLYDLGRMLVVNPPNMVVIAHPPQKEGPDRIRRSVAAMYRRAMKGRHIGRLLIMVDGAREGNFYRSPIFDP